MADEMKSKNDSTMDDFLKAIGGTWTVTKMEKSGQFVCVTYASNRIEGFTFSTDITDDSGQANIGDVMRMAMVKEYR